MASRSVKTDVAIFGRAAVTTIGAASFFQRTAILQVTTNALRILETGMSSALVCSSCCDDLQMGLSVKS
jgi:hypothetical protein